MTPLTMKTSHLYSVFRACLTLSWHALIIFKIYIIETKLDFASFNNKNLKDDGNLLANVTFPYKTLKLVRFNV